MDKIKNRNSDSHKGDNGKVLIVGGSDEYVGAPVLSALAAYRLGVDYVTIVTSEKAGFAMNSISPDLIVKKFKFEYLYIKFVADIVKISEDYDVVLIGPGLGYNKYTTKFVQKLVSLIKKPMVIDADAIKSLNFVPKNSVITPNKNEFELLTNKSLTIDQDANIEKIKEFANNSIILLKGKEDIIANKEKSVINKTGNSGMTVAGTGDVLSGLVAGFISLGYDLFEAAEKASYLNGKLGEVLYNKKGYGYLATDMIEEISNQLL